MNFLLRRDLPSHYKWLQVIAQKGAIMNNFFIFLAFVVVFEVRAGQQAQKNHGAGYTHI